MNKVKKLPVLFLVFLLIMGCSNNDSSRDSANDSNSVDKAIKEQINSEDDASENTDAETSDTESIDAEENSSMGSQAEPLEEVAPESADGVDYDLTTMSRGMIYATVYQMMAEPDDYIGKTIRMDGLYYAGYAEQTDQHYHYCIIQDAMACCAQGLEFVWDDGSHVYPDEYPQDNTNVVVQGVFETYQKEGGNYCRLKDATLEIKK